MSVRLRLLVASLFAGVSATFFACEPEAGVFVNGQRVLPDAGLDGYRPPSEAGTPDAAPACDPDAGTLCNGACVDTGSDSTHCGGCGVPCGPSQLCAAGACVANVLTALAFDVVDAEYSRALDRVVMVSASPMALHLYDPGSKTDAVIPLPAVPTSVSVGPDGHHAAVGHDAFLSYVDLDAQKTLGTFAVSDAIADVVLAGNGNAYAFPSSDTGAVHSIDITTGADTKVPAEEAGQYVYLEANGVLHPSLRSIYAVWTGGVPQTLVKYDISDGGMTLAARAVMYDPCSDLWISKDGLRIFTQCGYVFRASDDTTQDMEYAGSIASFENQIAALDDTSVNVTAVVTNGVGYGPFRPGDSLVTFDAQYLAQKSTQPLPRYAVGPKSFATEGRFLFYRNDGTSLVAIVLVDPASNAAHPFALATF